ncbi:MAG: hypothetical protein MJ252_16490 [archaeon]|nr:hypothetical protein [archaeon]
MSKKGNGPGKKSIAEQIESLRQRREDRKLKEDKKVLGNQGVDNIKVMDVEYEKMIKKKRYELYQSQPEEVYSIFNLF